MTPTTSERAYNIGAQNASVRNMIEQALKLAITNPQKSEELAQRVLDLAGSGSISGCLHNPLMIVAHRAAMQGNIRESERLLNRAEPDAIADNDWRCRAKIHRIRSLIECNRMNRLKALHHIGASIELHAHNGDFDVSGHRILGRMHWENSAYPQALEVLYLLISDRSEQVTSNEKAKALHLISLVYCGLEDMVRARNFNDQALEINRRNSHRKGVAICLYHKAHQLFEQGEYKLSLDIYREMLADFVTLENRKNIVRTLMSMSEVYFSLGQIEHSRDSLAQARELAKQADFVMEQLHISCYDAKFLHESGQPRQAVRTLKQVLEQAQTFNMVQLECEIHKKLAEAYAEAGLPVDSNEHVIQQQTLEQKMRGSKIREQITSIMFHYEFQVQQTHIRMLEQDNRSLADRNERLQQECRNLAASIERRNNSLQQVRRGLADLCKHSPGDYRQTLLMIQHSIDSTLGEGYDQHLWNLTFGESDEKFVQYLSSTFEGLTPTELKVCTLLKQNLTSMQIAEAINISPNTVNTHRQHIRRKLQLGREKNLTTFLQQTPLVSANDKPRVPE